MKIFVSYSREDGANFAKHIHKFMRNKGHDVFIDVNDIRIGKPWADSIEKNISECDFFVVILTPDTLTSPYVEREVLQAQRENKIIVPCIHEYVNYNEIKWDLDRIQGIEFSNEYQLVLNLYQRIKNYEDIKKPIDDIPESFQTVDTRPSDVTSPSKSNPDRLQEQKDFRKSLKENINKNQLKNSNDISTPTIKKTKGKFSDKYHFIQILGFKLNIIIIPIIAIAIIGVILSLSYFNALNSSERGSETTSDITDTIVSPLSNNTLQTYQFINSWGTNGTREGEFKYPLGISVDSSKGYVYVADSRNDRIQKFDSNGNFITKWGTNGTREGEFKYPNDVSVDSSKGYVYVADTFNNRIQKFDSNGNYITKWGSEGNGTGKFKYPTGISVNNSTGNVYVVDQGNNRIQKFDSNGNYITMWGSEGNGTGKFKYPSDVSVDSSNGYVYVADAFNDRIQKFDSNGIYRTKLGTNGTRDGEFNNPSDVSVDSSKGYVYVADSGNNRIQKFDSNGEFITKWGTNGTGEGEFEYPVGISVDSSSGIVYVSDPIDNYFSIDHQLEYNNQIQVFAPIK